MCRFCAEQSVNLPEEVIILYLQQSGGLLAQPPNKNHHKLSLKTVLILFYTSCFKTAMTKDPLCLLLRTEAAYNSQKALGHLQKSKGHP